MKRAILFLALAGALLGQTSEYPTVSRTAYGDITATNAACTMQACVWIVLPADAGSVSAQLSGTFTATLQFEQSVAGSVWVAATSTSGVTSAAAAGTWSFNLFGARYFRVRASAYSAGPVRVDLSAGSGQVISSTSEPGPAGPAGPIGPAGPAGQDGAPGVPGYSPNSLISGGGVSWTAGLSFSISAASYYIQNVPYNSAVTSLTLDAADETNDRIDVIAVNSSGAVVVLKGTPASPPTPVVPDPATQLQLTWVYIAAGATTPSNVTTDDVYHEGTEWTASRSGTPINLTSTSNPHAGTNDIEATTAVTGNYAQFVATAPFNPAIKNNLVFWIRPKAAWASTRSLQIRWYLSTAAKGSIVTLNENAFGFVSSTSAYQQIVIPMGLFAANGLSVDRLRITVAGSGTGIGFYLDDIILQSGVAAPVAPAGMTWCGAWNASTAYPVNCTVAYGNAAWVALAGNTNSAPTTANANWAITTPLVTNTETANYVFAGPTTGAAAAPTFRALVAADMPAGSGTVIASGAKALATAEIASAACTAAQTDTATGTATTDVVTASFNGDPTAVTGYVPLTTGMLTIIVYPTANNVNFKVCNNTAAPITPGAITLNWRVAR